ncbi:hypothetical protein FKR81_03065 [Lentzea tibetensis]|uniref:Indoleamine 2,3-dioxygenase n=1 Tax=Lentzea tibetensis TaxID=2591470 RepID=A0A563F1T0_9PSEU|nr:hypothetical protein [Lentzea tibetensis]TWP53752.1 hypothetical protein FKR81_03065 [Lentzea tibetensis]
MNEWTLRRFPELNQAILTGEPHPADLVRALRAEVFPSLPEPDACDETRARQIVTLLGMWGSACVRHHVQCGLASATDPRAVFDALDVRGEPFRSYFARVAVRTGTGHPDRDTYVSYFHWNPPAIRVHWSGVTRTAPGAFGDGEVRTYTGDPRERELVLFVKTAEAVEKAANETVEPLTRDFTGDAVDRMVAGAGLLNAVHRIFAEFTRLPPDRAMNAEFFSDTWRQYTNHWEPGDFPPSGVADTEFLARDLVLGIDVPDYASHVRHVHPALLPADRGRLTSLIGRVPLPTQILRRLGITRLPTDTGDLLALATAHPELAACYLLLAENVRVASTHLNFTKRYVFDLRRDRDAAGVPDTPVVSGRAGSTGIPEAILERLKRGRRNHPLTAFERVPRSALTAIAGMPPAPPLGEVVSVATPTDDWTSSPA